jgi:hypothetical protein
VWRVMLTGTDVFASALCVWLVAGSLTGVACLVGGQVGWSPPRPARAVTRVVSESNSGVRAPARLTPTPRPP